MGLDVYFHKTTIPFKGEKDSSDDFNNFYSEVNNDARKNAREKFQKLLAPLRDAWEELQTNDYWRNIYNERYFAFIEKARPIICRNGLVFEIYPFTAQVIDFPELENKIEDFVKHYYEPYDAYFRKVNFLFKYYEDKGKMYDQYYAFTDADDIDDLIWRCEQVLKDHKLAHELLPTQDGFFFGSTEYDKWYFNDVRSCLKQMKKYRKLLKDGVTGFVVFSW